MRAEPNRPELAVLRGKRTEQALRQWTLSFAGGNERRAARYLEALALFLGQPTEGTEWQSYVGSLSPNTRKAYSFALNEFFEWLAAKHHRVVPPDAVTQADAEQYVLWLANKPFGLQEEKLRDGDMRDRHAIYKAVEKLGSGTIRDVAAALPLTLRRAHERSDEPRRKPRFDYHWLNRHLGRMVLHRALSRSPTMEQLRKSSPRAGIDDFIIEIERGGEVEGIDLMDVFTYSLPPPRGVSRTTIRARLAALSSFWDILLNVDAGDAPLVKQNVFHVVKKRVGRGLRAEQKQAAAQQRIDPVLVPWLLRAADQGKKLPQMRDRALLYLLIFTGVRVEEAIQLRRDPPPKSEEHAWPGWLDMTCEPPIFVVTRKGGLRKRLPYPPIALKALAEFQAELERQAAPLGSQSDNKKEPRYVHPDSPKWRYADLARSTDAPLFPPLWLWGANSTLGYREVKPNLPNTYGGFSYKRPMTRAGVAAILGRLAGKMRIVTEDGEEREATKQEKRQVHPHALRHFALNAMAAEGKELRTIQAMAGHASVTTTEQYLEEVEDEVALSGQEQVLRYLSRFEPETPVCPVRPPEAEAPKEVPPAEPTRRPKEPPIEVTGYTVPEAAPQPPPPPAPAAVRAAAQAPQAPAGPALPDNDVPVAPVTAEPPIKSVETGAGWALESGDEVIEIGGKEPGPDQDEASEVQMINDQSAGCPDDFYDRMEDVQRLIAHLLQAKTEGDRAAERQADKDLKEAQKRLEKVEFTMLARKTRAGDKVVAVQEIKRKGTRRVERVEKVQQNAWLRKHYDPWPLHHGIGDKTLLPWFARGVPTTHGYVLAESTARGQHVQVPPLPILSPEQVSPETVGGKKVMDFVERIYLEWLHGDPSRGIGPSPSRTYGLVKWFGFFSYVTWKLEQYKTDTGLGADWQPWSALCALGKDLRTHRDDWIEAWLRANAHTYRTTIRAFEKVPRGKALEQEHEFWGAFEAASFEGATLTVDIPGWFAENDPIATLPPVEYDRFAKWIASVTGQRLTRVRARERKDQAALGKKRQEISVDEVDLNLILYFEDVDALDEAIREGDKEEAGIRRMSIDALTERFRELGMPDPASPEFAKIRDRGERRKALIDAMLETRQDTEQTTENMLKDSDLFDKRYFLIDRMRHTISHTEEFKEEFRKKYGLDSELVLRRAARALWEHVKEHKIEEKKLGPAKYSLLYSIMLCYISWIVPPGEEMERRMAELGLEGASEPRARRQWMERYVGTVRDLIFRPGLEEPEVESDEEVLAAIREEHGLDEESARTALEEAKFRQHIAAEMEEEVERLPFRGLEELLGEAGAIRIEAPKLAEEERKRFEREREEAGVAPVRVIRRKKVAKNPGLSIIGLDGETATRLYRIPADYAPNAGQAMYLTPGAWREAARYTENARRALPSPFAMIRAMTAP